MKQLKLCPVCNSRHLKTWGKNKISNSHPPKTLKDVENHLLLAKLEKSRIERAMSLCLSCTFLFQNPTYDERDLYNIYRSDGPKYVDYAKLIGKSEQDLWETNAARQNRKKRQLRYARLIQTRKAVNILDYGGAEGENMLHESLNDTKRFVYNFGERTIKNSWLHDISNLDTEQRFDFIFHTHVLEHEPDPKASLRKLRKIINPTGTLYLEVPFEYWERLITRRAGAPWHLNSFNSITLRHLSQSTGWRCSQVTVAPLPYTGNIIPCLYAILTPCTEAKPPSFLKKANAFGHDFLHFCQMRFPRGKKF